MSYAIPQRTEVVTCVDCPGTFTRHKRKHGANPATRCPLCRREHKAKMHREWEERRREEREAKRAKHRAVSRASYYRRKEQSPEHQHDQALSVRKAKMAAMPERTCRCGRPFRASATSLIVLCPICALSSMGALPERHGPHPLARIAAEA